MITPIPAHSSLAPEPVEAILPTPSRLQALQLWLTQAWNSIFKQLLSEHYPEPIIIRLQGQGGTYFWKIYDPKTHSNTYCGSDQEVMIWLDSHWHGK
ncbi:MAG: hypothetical protein NW237_09490 [Cyanobacteriota bacterium]|nr:hypothetical protein [Cyanobacteriota bacterium]